ncbi:MAG: hypothetical protein R3F17_03820 [Planctomycetota bacterium]
MIRDRVRPSDDFPEVARGVLAEMEASVDALRTDVDLVDRYFSSRSSTARSVAEALYEGSFVSDRACNLAYAAQHSTILPQVFHDKRRPTIRIPCARVVFPAPAPPPLGPRRCAQTLEWRRSRASTAWSS